MMIAVSMIRISSWSDAISFDALAPWCPPQTLIDSGDGVRPC